VLEPEPLELEAELVGALGAADDDDWVGLGVPLLEVALGDSLGDWLGDVVEVEEPVSPPTPQSVEVSENDSTGSPSRAAFMNSAKIAVGKLEPPTEPSPPVPASDMGLPLESSLVSITEAASCGV